MKMYQSKKTGMGLWGSRRTARRGQSLVEFALTLPVLLTILAGVVEVASILMTYNRVQLAAREGTRFGAMGGTPTGIRDVVQQASSDALSMTDEQMTVWVIRPVIDVSGTTWSWEAPVTAASWGTAAQCVFPAECTEDVSPILSPSTVRDEMKAIGGTTASDIDGTRFVLTLVRYDTDMILRLPWFTPAETDGRFRMWAYAIMRQEVTQEAVAQKSAGCSAYSMALSSTRIPTNIQEGDKIIAPLNNMWSVGADDGFGFLGWNIDHIGNPADINNDASGCQKGSMTFPGNSVGCYHPTNANFNTSYIELDTDPPDTSMHRNDWVLAHEDKMSSAVWSELMKEGGHAKLGRALRIIVYNHETGVNPGLYHSPSTGGEHWKYQIGGFAIVRLLDDDHGSCNGGGGCGGNQQLAFEWIRWDTSCGYE